jgi:hypothetical protein
MSEVKKFVGQPVLSQILDVIPSSLIQQSGRKRQANRYYKSFLPSNIFYTNHQTEELSSKQCFHEITEPKNFSASSLNMAMCVG